MDSLTWSDADALAYIASYPDLIAAFGADPAAARLHYARFGAAEGRTIRFDGLAYIASYDDLIGAFGADAAAGARHFIQFGANEGRHVGFDGLAYLASNGDLLAAFGSDVAAAERHYITIGRTEHRATDFDAVGYLLSQPDLQAAGLGAGGALRHWVEYGFAEHRYGDAAFGREQPDHVLESDSSVVSMVEQAGDRDWYAIRLSPDQVVDLKLDLAGVAALDVYDAAGHHIAGGAGLGEASVTLGGAGDYYVVARGAFGFTGSYTLSESEQRTDVVGTDSPETITGTVASEHIQGLQGDDTITAGGGNDLIEGNGGSDDLTGGAGNDIIYGNNMADDGQDGDFPAYTQGFDELYDLSGGNDRLYGQGGSDYMSVARNGTIATNVVMDGGTGNDVILFSSFHDVDTVIAIGGAGDDGINVQNVAAATIDAGPDNDYVAIRILGGRQTIALGSGSDTLTFRDDYGHDGPIVSPSIVVTDFEHGVDRLDLGNYLAKTLSGWDHSDPFATGYIHIQPFLGVSVLQIDTNGGGDHYQSIAVFEPTSAGAITAADIFF